MTMTVEKKILLGGKWQTSPEQIEIKDKYSGESIALVHRASEAQAEEGIQWAVKAFEETKRLPVYKRVTLLESIARKIEERKDEFAETMTRESGKPISFSRLEVSRAVFNFTIAAEEAKRIGGEVIPMELQPDAEGRYAITQRFPHRADIRHFSFQLSFEPGCAQGCPCSGNRQHHDSKAAIGLPSFGAAAC